MSCSVEPVAPDTSGYFQFAELTESTTERPPSRTPSNGVSCTQAYPWKYYFHTSTHPSASQITETYKIWPDRAQVLGPAYNAATSPGPGHDPFTVTFVIENRGNTPIKFSVNGGATWIDIDRGGAPAYYSMTVNANPNPCGLALENSLTFYSTVMYKSTGCPPGANFFSVRWSISAISYPQWSYYALGPYHGGLSSGWTWTPPSYPCSFTP